MDLNSVKSRFYLLLTLACLFSYSLRSQNISIDRVEIDGLDILIYYDLSDQNPENTYTINLYTSLDDYISPLKEVEGDLGLEVRTGVNKKLIWHASEELGDDFKGRLAFEIKGRIYVPFVSFDAMKRTYKRGKPQTIAWTGGSSGTVLTWELYNKDEELVHTFPPVPNVGNYEILIPKDVTPGKGFQFKVSDSRNRDDVVYTGTFSIARQIPLLAKGAAVAGIAAIVYLLLPQDDTIPNPPDLN